MKDPQIKLELFSETDAARILGISRFALRGLRLSGKGPVFYKYSKTLIRYRREDLFSFLRGAKHETQSKTLKKELPG